MALRKWFAEQMTKADHNTSCYYCTGSPSEGEQFYYIKYNTDSMCCILSKEWVLMLIERGILDWPNSIHARLQIAEKSDGFIGIDSEGIRLFLDINNQNYSDLGQKYGSYWLRARK